MKYILYILILLLNDLTSYSQWIESPFKSEIDQLVKEKTDSIIEYGMAFGSFGETSPYSFIIYKKNGRIDYFKCYGIRDKLSRQNIVTKSAIKEIDKTDSLFYEVDKFFKIMQKEEFRPYAFKKIVNDSSVIIEPMGADHSIYSLNIYVGKIVMRKHFTLDALWEYFLDPNEKNENYNYNSSTKMGILIKRIQRKFDPQTLYPPK